MLLGFQFLRLRANIGVYFMLEAYFGKKSSYLVEKKMLENWLVSLESKILKALKFLGGKLL